jgi:UDP-N-acetylmuramate dehydrogenase
MLLGSGTNVLFPDEGYDGVVISFTRLNTIGVVDNEITADAGVMLARVVLKTIDLGLAGLEELIDIPGTVGGAVAGNAGAGRQAVCGCLIHVRLAYRDGTLGWVSAETLHPSYRSVDLAEGTAVLSARWALATSESALLKEKARVVSERRKSAQPRGLPTAGCVFKNPDGESAGTLIDRAELKGARVGGAVISQKHANFIVIDGPARSDDVKALIEMVRSQVHGTLGITLEPELVVVEEQTA